MQRKRVLEAIQPHLPAGVTADLRPCHSQIGSGALPLDLMPSCAVTLALKAAKRGASGLTLDGLAAKLRSGAVPVIGRIADGRIWLDLRCLEPDDEPLLIEQFSTLTP